MSAQNLLRFVLCVLFITSAYQAHAFRWQDLWYTPDQQAQALMEKGDFLKAQSLFQQEAWRAAAAYRAGDYKQAAKELESVSTEQGYYNRGNALAKMEQYEDAIKAYDNALSLNPSNQDALYNRKLVAELLKKKQEQQNQNKENSSKDEQSKNKQSQDKNDNSQQKNPSQNKDSKPSDQSQQASQNQGKDDNEKQKDSDKQNQSLEKDKKQAKKSDKKDTPVTDSGSQEAREKQQAKEQWLQLIPDDPGGLMREKFLRDYLRRQRGWSQ